MHTARPGRWSAILTDPRLLPVVLAVGIAGCRAGAHAPATSVPSVLDSLHTQSIAGMVGRQGTLQDGQYRITVPQHDLAVTVDGFRISAPMGLGSWITFTPAAGGAVIMGDVVLLENEVGPVQQVVVQHGLTLTALHNHFVRMEPRVMYMHVGGAGSQEDLSRGVRAILARVAELRGRDPSSPAGSPVVNTLDTAEIDRILGHRGEMNAGVYRQTVARPDVSLRAHGVPVTSFMGFNTWAAWQGTPEHAAVAGDFAMLQHEVAPVVAALVTHGIEVVAVHNHMVHEDPRIVFLHYWGTGSARQLANGLRAALDRTGT